MYKKLNEIIFHSNNIDVYKTVWPESWNWVLLRYSGLSFRLSGLILDIFRICIFWPPGRFSYYLLQCIFLFPIVLIIQILLLKIIPTSLLYFLFRRVYGMGRINASPIPRKFKFSFFIIPCICQILDDFRRIFLTVLDPCNFKLFFVKS